jgi:hypothetical protein
MTSVEKRESESDQHRGFVVHMFVDVHRYVTKPKQEMTLVCCKETGQLDMKSWTISRKSIENTFQTAFEGESIQNV